jgi:hypothetical protein
LIYAIFARQMKQTILQISSVSIGEGQERICHLHPDDANKMIKLQNRASNRQTRRELAFYRNQAWLKNTGCGQLPLFKQLKIHSAEMIEACDSSPKVLEANYRKTI